MLAQEWSHQLEPIVVETQEAAVRSALSKGFDVVIDNTNFNDHFKHRFIRVAQSYDATFEVKEFRTSLADCVSRDFLRENPVGIEVIKGMWKKYKLEKWCE